MPNEKHPVPKTAREWRERWVRLQRIEMGEIDPPNARHPTPKHLSAAARKRVCEVLALQAGLPLPDWNRLERGKSETIDVAPIEAAWDKLQRDRARRYEVLGLSLENHGSRVRCRRCGDMLMDVPHGLVGVAASALYVQHAQRTGCHA